MIQGKRSIGYGILAIIIIVLVIAFVLLTYTNTFAGIIKKGSDVEVCRLSVLAQAQTKVAGQSPVSLKCSRREVNFFDNKVEINGKKEAKYEFKKLDDNIVNKVVAEELRLCWYMMGEGEVDVFKQHIGVGGENVCVICSQIGFDGSLKQKEFGGITDYLKGERVLGKDEYYIDYLVKSQRNIYLKLPYLGELPYTHYILSAILGTYGTTDLIKDPSKLGEEAKKSKSFDTSKNYIVYFLGFKPAKFSEWLREYESAYYIGLGEPEKVAKECRRLVN